MAGWVGWLDWTGVFDCKNTVWLGFFRWWWRLLERRWILTDLQNIKINQYRFGLSLNCRIAERFWWSCKWKCIQLCLSTFFKTYFLSDFSAFLMTDYNFFVVVISCQENCFNFVILYLNLFCHCISWPILMPGSMGMLTSIKKQYKNVCFIDDFRLDFFNICNKRYYISNVSSIS